MEQLLSVLWNFTSQIFAINLHLKRIPAHSIRLMQSIYFIVITYFVFFLTIYLTFRTLKVRSGTDSEFVFLEASQSWRDRQDKWSTLPRPYSARPFRPGWGSSEKPPSSLGARIPWFAGRVFSCSWSRENFWKPKINTEEMFEWGVVAFMRVNILLKFYLVLFQGQVWCPVSRVAWMVDGCDGSC